VATDSAYGEASPSGVPGRSRSPRSAAVQELGVQRALLGLRLMLSRNPVLHYVFARMELAEERGLGLKSMKTRAEEAGLPLPRYAWEPPYLALTLFRTADSAARVLAESVLQEMTATEWKGWSFVAGRTRVTQGEYARHLEVTARTAQRHLSHFVELGLLRRRGQGPATSYEVLPG